MAKAFLINHWIKNYLRTYGSFHKILTAHVDDYTTRCLTDSPYFKKHFKMIAIDLNKQKAIDADPKAIQQINFTEKLAWAGNAT